MQRTLTVNGALFANRYRNMQAQSFVTACVDPTRPNTCIASEYTSNGGTVDANGAELEINWVPGKNYFLNGSLALLDAKFGNYQVARLDGLGNLGGRQNVGVPTAQAPGLQLQGWQPALSPRFTAAAQTGWVFGAGTEQQITPIVQVAYSSQYWSFDYNVPGSEQAAFTKIDLRLRWRDAKRGSACCGRRR
jgi:outer membrane receptor protein involved in Fe transport